MRLKLTILALVAAFFTASQVEAGWVWKRVRTNCGYTYRKVFVADPIQQQNTTTVVNNLIGIPVPVTYSQPIAAQGSTVYGYSSVAETYNAVDRGVLFNQAARLTDQAQQLAGQAFTDFSSLVESESRHQAEIAQIIARGQAAAQALSATKGDPPTIVQRTFAFRVTQDAQGELDVEKVQCEAGNTNIQPDNPFNLVTPPQDFAALVEKRCLRCHGGAETYGDLDFKDRLTSKQVRSIKARVKSDNPDLRMPKKSPSEPGEPLPPDELQRFLLELQ